MRQEALQAKQSMFNRHAAAEKALREHKDLLATAREELGGQRSLVETLRANAKNLRQQLGACKVCARCLSAPSRGTLYTAGWRIMVPACRCQAHGAVEATTRLVIPVHAVAVIRRWHHKLLLHAKVHARADVQVLPCRKRRRMRRRA